MLLNSDMKVALENGDIVVLEAVIFRADGDMDDGKTVASATYVFDAFTSALPLPTVIAVLLVGFCSVMLKVSLSPP